MLASGERLSRLWRDVFVQMLDDYTSVLHHAGVAATIIRAWQESDLTTALSRYSEETTEAQVPTGPRDPSDYGKLIDELIEIGVITRRTNGKLDLPDVYRIGFDLGRKGGVPRIQP